MDPWPLSIGTGGRFRSESVAVFVGIRNHATILEMNVESYRRRAAIERKRAPARQATARATTKDEP